MGYEAYSEWGSWYVGEDVGIRNWTWERLVQSFGLCHLLGRGGFERKKCSFSDQNPNTLDDSNVCMCVWGVSQPAPQPALQSHVSDGLHLTSPDAHKHL